MYAKFLRVSGVEFCYFFSCPTLLWLFSHNLIKSDEDENIKIGKMLHQDKYLKERKERELFRSKIDVVKIGQEYTVYEIKKMAVNEQHIFQLKYYMYQIYKTTGCTVKGIITSPQFRKVIFLSEEDKKKIEESLDKILEVKNLQNPPKPIKKPICKKCAYRNFCFGDEGE